MIFDQVRWKKQLGNIGLEDSGITFRATTPGDGAVDSSLPTINIPWSRIAKHQVSPANYPKPLLKINLTDGSNTTFQLPERSALEKIRLSITQFLKQARSNGVLGNSSSSSATLSSALAATRSTLLAAHPNLRQQHHYLVNETQTVSEEDFWKTHQDLIEEEYARMSGVAKAGSTSLLKSHVPAAGKVTLGVEEMRQIFILYPAVHKAYEEKVPLSLSDEEFWRKYLESEYFHRDRGRIGTAARNHQPNNSSASKKAENSNDKKGNSGPTVEEQDARAAAVSTDDLFSRYEQKLLERNAASAEGGEVGRHRRWGTHLAVGQFDLAQTLETERGKLLEGPRDNHPPNPSNDGKGARVIEKYNRHWAMVLHPDEAVAGCNLLEVARRSVLESNPDDDDAKAQGGLDEEMQRLSDFAASSTDHANHATGVAVHEGENYEELSLRNIEAYYNGSRLNQEINSRGHQKETEAALAKRHSDFSTVMAAKAAAIAKSSVASETRGILEPERCFPPAELGRGLLTALTKKMQEDARTEAASLEMVNRLPDDFRNKLQSYFRRSSELLRHFFGLRRLEEEHRLANAGNNSSSTSGYSQKLSRINAAMASFYREMEGMRRDLPQTATGEMMRKMCLPIMDQLDWAFKLHREGSGGGGGGFVDVEEN
ncbi:hypothetical protein ACA910_005834 [Epithemia clementina (nom. ined.)]